MSTEVKPSPEGVPGALSEQDLQALHAGEVTFPGAGGSPVEGYLAGPLAPGRHPGVVVIHEASGLNDHIRDVCNRFAKLGYLALGVNLYTREGGPPTPGDMPAVMERLFSMSDATAIGDLEGAARFLRSRDDASARVGCIGFCMGGRYSLLFACSSEELDACVDCWGGFIDMATPQERSTLERPVPPLELTGQLHCPVFAAIGAEDQNPSPEHGAALRERAAGSEQEVQVEVFADAGHAFFADYRPDRYRPAAAHALWERVVPFFARHLEAS